MVESSTKPEYMHNQPININENTVKFVKYRGLRRVWTILVQKFSNEEGEGFRAEVLEVPVTLTVFTTRISKTEHGIPIACMDCFELTVNNNKFTNVYELEAVYVIADVPYAVPICLADLAQRLIQFVNMVRQ